MAKKVSDEAKVVAFFSNASQETANTVLGIVKHLLSTRFSGPRKTRKARTASAPAQPSGVASGKE